MVFSFLSLIAIEHMLFIYAYQEHGSYVQSIVHIRTCFRNIRKSWPVYPWMFNEDSKMVWFYYSPKTWHMYSDTAKY